MIGWVRSRSRKWVYPHEGDCFANLPFFRIFAQLGFFFFSFFKALPHCWSKILTWLALQLTSMKDKLGTRSRRRRTCSHFGGVAWITFPISLIYHDREFQTNLLLFLHGESQYGQYGEVVDQGFIQEPITLASSILDLL